MECGSGEKGGERNNQKHREESRSQGSFKLNRTGCHVVTILSLRNKMAGREELQIRRANPDLSRTQGPTLFRGTVTEGGPSWRPLELAPRPRLEPATQTKTSHVIMQFRSCDFELFQRRVPRKKEKKNELGPKTTISPSRPNSNSPRSRLQVSHSFSFLLQCRTTTSTSHTSQTPPNWPRRCHSLPSVSSLMIRHL